MAVARSILLRTIPTKVWDAGESWSLDRYGCMKHLHRHRTPGMQSSVARGSFSAQQKSAELACDRRCHGLARTVSDPHSERMESVKHAMSVTKDVNLSTTAGT